MTKAFLFVVTVPRASYEKQMKNELKNSKVCSPSRGEGNISFGVESEVSHTKPNMNNVNNDLKRDTDLKYLTEKFGLAVDVNKARESGDKVVRDSVGGDGKFLLFSQEYKNGGSERNGKGRESEVVSPRLTKKACRSLKDYIAGLKQDPLQDGGFTPPRKHKVDSDWDKGDDDIPMEKV